ncbi:hypothetical protein ACFYNY_19580 [Streptomyces sp. NPDC006530]|uniref:hypothetical protein n=1 Tax=Streptomyces sp. NPDC006530 TaxID=3364750 RepID=UPI003689E290
MGIAALGADRGFGSLDEETRRRFRAIQAVTDYDAEQAQRERDGTPKPRRSDDRSAGTGW